MKETLSGKTVLITGSTDGLGKLVAKHLLEQDAFVILHGRNREKGDQLVEELKSLTGKDALKFYQGDYASLEKVNLLCKEILASHSKIDILINNVGIGSGKSNQRELSEEGAELRFTVNYLAHVLLTETLLPVLPPKSARIINVASAGQELINFQNLMLEKAYDGFFAYKQSKTALIMYTFDLAERLKDTGIKVNAVHPASLMNTKMVLEALGYSLTKVEQGAEAVENLLYVNTTGKYYDGKQQSKAIAQAYDLKARTTLKKITGEFLEKYLQVEQ